MRTLASSLPLAVYEDRLPADDARLCGAVVGVDVAGFAASMPPPAFGLMGFTTLILLPMRVMRDVAGALLGAAPAAVMFGAAATVGAGGACIAPVAPNLAVREVVAGRVGDVLGAPVVEPRGAVSTSGSAQQPQQPPCWRPRRARRVPPSASGAMSRRSRTQMMAPAAADGSATVVSTLPDDGTDAPAAVGTVDMTRSIL